MSIHDLALSGTHSRTVPSTDPLLASRIVTKTTISSGTKLVPSRCCELDAAVAAAERQYEVVLCRESARRESSSQSDASLTAMRGEVLLTALGPQRIPPRFLEPLQLAVSDARQKRLASMEAWWRQSITDIAERISRQMPLCRSGGGDETSTSPLVSVDAHCGGSVVVDRSAGLPTEPLYPTASDAIGTASMNLLRHPHSNNVEPENPNVTRTMKNTSTSTLPPLRVTFAVASLLAGHPSFSNGQADRMTRVATELAVLRVSKAATKPEVPRR